MNIKIFALLTAILFTVSSAYAESYSFGDTPSFTPVDFELTGSEPAPISTSSINVSGATGTITDLSVTLSGINTTSLMDMTFVLVGPNNTGVVLASHAGGMGTWWGGNPANQTDLSLTFNDNAASKIGISTGYDDARNRRVESGSYQTSAYSEVPQWFQAYFPYPQYYTKIALNNPVESGIFGNIDFSENNLLSAFNDISANGNWDLLAYDNLADNQTTVNGWSLNITTSPATAGAVPEPAEWMLIGLCACGIVILKLREKHQASLT